MSVQKAKDFLVQIATDEAAAAKARAAHETALLSVAKELGYSFDPAHLREAMSDIQDLDELSDDALDSVSGGLIGLPTLPRPGGGLAGLAGFRGGLSRVRFRADSAF